VLKNPSTSPSKIEVLVASFHLSNLSLWSLSVALLYHSYILQMWINYLTQVQGTFHAFSPAFGLSDFHSAVVIVVQIITLCRAVGAGSYYISGKIVTMVKKKKSF